MPIYEYWCKKCEIKFEVLFHPRLLKIIHDQDINECPNCKNLCKKTISSPFLQQESMRRRLLGGRGRMPETMKRVMRGEDPMTRKKDDFDEV